MDSVKVWLYAIASMLLAAALAPWLYNLGRALAEVTDGKQTNGIVEWVAEGCRKAGLAIYFKWAWGIAGAVLAVPFIGWLKVGRGVGNRTAAWSVRVPGGWRVNDGGQRLRFRLSGGWDGLSGFGLSVALVAVLGAAVLLIGAFRWSGEPVGLAGTAGRMLPWAVGLAVVNEVVFRGFAMGVFLRAVGVPAAITMAALLSAAVGFFGPLAGSVVVDPEGSAAGFHLLGLLAKRLADPWVLTAGFLPLFALGGLLGYARWRTASLWLPVGLHAGWIFSTRLFQELAKPLHLPAPFARALVGDTLQHGWIPLVALVVAGIVVHFIIPVQEDFEYGGD